MIPRYQKIIFFLLLALSITMTVVLVRLRERTHDRLLRGEDLGPTAAPVVTPAQQAMLVVASDDNGTLSAQPISLPLPQDSNARARALLEKLLAVYAAPGASHFVGAADSSSRPVANVFLLPVPDATASGRAAQPTGQLAVVNLAQQFADSHPSGIQTEMLTVLSICATLHANFPSITEVRFLVNGVARSTLAGHADLTRVYLTQDLATASESSGGDAR